MNMAYEFINLYIYIKESRVRYTIYNSRTAGTIRLKIGRELFYNHETYFYFPPRL